MGPLWQAAMGLKAYDSCGPPSPPLRPVRFDGEELWRAAGRGDLARVTALLKSDPGLVHAREPEGAQTALIAAARMGRVEVRGTWSALEKCLLA
jgi:hypothetical protein